MNEAHDKYHAAIAADDAWTAELRRLHDAFVVARDALHSAWKIAS